jgi:hypothetical protein
MKTVEMKFTNSDARPKVVVINCARNSCEHIAAWYGAYFAGDRYNIKIDGKPVKKDQNGDILP